MCEYGFEENTDFIAITQKRVTAQKNETTYIDYAININMAKELSMIQKTDKGKQARQYFIACGEKLLATNFGRIKNDPNKMRKVAVEYVELCGMKKGDNQYSIGKNCRAKSQEDMAKELGISERNLRYLLEIERKLTPEVKELIDTGIISKTSASKIWVKLSEEEQMELLEDLGKDAIAKMTQSQIQQYINIKFKLPTQKV